MKPSKDYEYYLHHDPCKVCICCNNQYVESDEYPCSVCHNFSEFIPEGGESPVESDWLNNVYEYTEVLELMDEIIDKIHMLDEKIPNAGIDKHAEELLSHINILKASSAENWMFDPRDFGGPCYDTSTGSIVDCDECSKQSCAFKGRNRYV